MPELNHLALFTLVDTDPRLGFPHSKNKGSLVHAFRLAEIMIDGEKNPPPEEMILKGVQE